MEQEGQEGRKEGSITNPRYMHEIIRTALVVQAGSQKSRAVEQAMPEGPI
jgi:hypothetical protein